MLYSEWAVCSGLYKPDKKEIEAMGVERDPATVTGPQPDRRAYGDASAGSEEQTARPDGGENVGAAYAPGTVRTTGNLIYGIVAIVAFVVLVGLYILVVAR